jgi:hypothetical protein
MYRVILLLRVGTWGEHFWQSTYQSDSVPDITALRQSHRVFDVAIFNTETGHYLY